MTTTTSIFIRHRLLCHRKSPSIATAYDLVHKKQPWLDPFHHGQNQKQLLTTTTRTISPGCCNQLLCSDSSFQWNDAFQRQRRWSSSSSFPLASASFSTTTATTTPTDMNDDKMIAFLQKLQDSPSLKTIQYAFQQMERFTNTKDDNYSNSTLTFSVRQLQNMAFQMILAWKKFYRTSHFDDTHAEFTPRRVFQTIQGWHTRLEAMQPDVADDDNLVASPSSATTPIHLLPCHYVVLREAASSMDPELADDIYRFVLAQVSKNPTSVLAFHDQHHDDDYYSHEIKQSRFRPLQVVLECWHQSLVSRRRQDAAERADALLRFANSWYNEHAKTTANKNNDNNNDMAMMITTLAKPNRVAYNIVMTAWSKSNALHAPERAQALYDDMIQEWQSSLSSTTSPSSTADDTTSYYSNNNSDVKPNALTFAMLILTWGRKGDRKTNRKTGQHKHDVTGAKQAQAIFDEMQKYYEESNFTDPDLRADASVYTSLMYAWAKIGDAPRVEAMLQQMELLPSSALTSQDGGKPHWRYAYNLVLEAWANRRDKYSKQREAPRRAQALLELMLKKSTSGFPELKPDLHSYSTLIKVWSRTETPHGAAQAQVVFNELLLQYRKSGDVHLRPTPLLYGSLMDAWGKSNEPEKAEQVLRDMMKSNDCPVDARCFNTIMNAWARSGAVDAAERSQALFDEMMARPQAYLKPDTFTYGTLINAWSRSPRKDRAEQAQRVFDMAMQQNKSDALVDAVTLNSLLDAWTKVGDPERAEAILRSLNERADRMGGNTPLQPNIASYNTVMYGWVKSDLPDAAERVQALYDDLMQRYDDARRNNFGSSGGRLGHESLIPDTITYFAVISAWCKSPSSAAETMAKKAFDDIVRRFHAGETWMEPELIKLQRMIREAMVRWAGTQQQQQNGDPKGL